jgi:hypothetical protein
MEESTNTNSFSNVSLVNDQMGKLTNITTYKDLFILGLNLVFYVGIVTAMLFVIIAGIKIITSSGDQQKLEEGKNTLINALIGVVIVVGYRVILGVVLKLLGSQEVEKYLE